MQIRINASNIPGLLGKNKYTTIPEAILATWRSSDRKSYNDALHRNNLKTKDEIIQETLQFIPDAKKRRVKQQEPKMMFVDEEKAEQQQQQQRVTKDHYKAAEYLYNTSRGIDKEDVIFNRISHVIKEKTFEKRDDLMVKDLGEIRAGCSVVLQGKIDGISEDSKIILEIKTRMHKLFLEKKEHELYQIAAYLLLLPEAEGALLVEGFFRSHEPDLNVHYIKREELQRYIIEIQDHIIELSDIVARIISDTAIQDAFLRSPRPELVIKKILSERGE